MNPGILHYAPGEIMSIVKIITDSTAYLPKTLIDQYSIEVVPLTLQWNGKSYRDGVDILPDEFYTRLSQSDTIPTTSQATVSEFFIPFKRILDEGNEAMVLPISSGISGSVFSAIQAKEMLKTDHIEVMDTKLVSMALGFMVLAAARAAQDGASLAEVKAVAVDAYSKIGVYFIVDTLTYLHKGGRINSAKRLLGSILSVKPVLAIIDGKIELVSSVMTKKKAVAKMVSLVEEGIGDRRPVRISVFHALAREEAIELQDTLVKQFNADEAILSDVSPVIGTHVGPGTLSIAYMAG
jgi:DegV family protein with EDD domain